MPGNWRHSLHLFSRDRWVRVVLLAGALDLLWHAPRLWRGAAWPGAGFLQFLFYLGLLWLAVRWLARMLPRFMWAVRNRMLVTFFFLAVIPVLLTLALFGIALYIFYGQYSVYLLSHDFNASIEQVKDANALVVAALRQQPHPGRLADAEIRYYNHIVFPDHSVLAYYYDASGRPRQPHALPLPSWLRGGFEGILMLPGGYYVAAYRSLYPTHARSPALLTLLPIDRSFIDQVTRSLGQVQLLTRQRLLPRPSRGGPQATPLSQPSPRAGGPGAAPVQSLHVLPLPESRVGLPPAGNIFDLRIYFPAYLRVVDARTGVHWSLLLSVSTRPSLLNRRLFSAMNLSPHTGSNPALTLLATVGIIFLIFELMSLLFGLRLTRTITTAISDLYIGTEYINRGEFDYRIPVSTRDQLAALETSFNTMSGSIRRLLREEQEKLRLESDLNIAQEVQAQLFPSRVPRVRGLELCGRCLPARLVSGDYFDFIPLDEAAGSESPAMRVALALGDVSGKGISSALLMATVSSAIRAYQILPAGALAAPPAAADGFDAPPAAGIAAPRASGAAAPPAAGDGPGAGAGLDPAPQAVLQRLNRQLYLGTPPEKYITLFYAVYDAAQQTLAYSNAGHPPPVILSRNGRRRLDLGGTVAGLFPEVGYEQETLALRPGDLLVAWSDGLTEPENEYGEEFGEERLLDLLERHRQRPLAEICELLLRSLRDWCGEQEQPDDATLILARAI